MQKNFISEVDERNIILHKLYAICGHIEESAKRGLIPDNFCDDRKGKNEDGQVKELGNDAFDKEDNKVVETSDNKESDLNKLEGGIVNEGKTKSPEKMELIKSTEKKESDKLEVSMVNEGNTKSPEKTELITSTEKKVTDKLQGSILKEIVKPSPKKKDKKVSPIKKISPKKKEKVKVPKNVTFT